MKSLYLRIYLTVLAALALFALVSAGLMQRHIQQERQHFAASAQERVEAWGELLQRSLPIATAPVAQQAAELDEWSNRLRLPLALDDEQGQRIGASETYAQREREASAGVRRAQPIRLVDGRTLWIMRPTSMHPPGMAPGRGLAHRDPPPPPLWGWAALPAGGLGFAALSLLLFGAIALGAWPVVRRLTRRLESLKRGVEAFGAGALHQRVAEDGKDEVAALGASFNQAASRIETLLNTHRSLLANASHELRSPLARLKMAVSMMDDAPAPQRAALAREIHVNIGELDALVEELLLASRLEAQAVEPLHEAVDLLALAAEEASRVAARVDGEALMVSGDERLLRRALRNLLDNARRYGEGEIDVQLQRGAAGGVELSVCDRGPGVPPGYRERIFDAFFRMPGHAEREGGVGLGLSLVRQIAQRHGGTVRCEPRDGGGSCFVLALPAA